MGECTPITVILVDDGLLSRLTYFTVSHTHPKARNKTLVARQRQSHHVHVHVYTCIYTINVHADIM